MCVGVGCGGMSRAFGVLTREILLVQLHANRFHVSYSFGIDCMIMVCSCVHCSNSYVLDTADATGQTRGFPHYYIGRQSFEISYNSM